MAEWNLNALAVSKKAVDDQEKMFRIEQVLWEIRQLALASQ